MDSDQDSDQPAKKRRVTRACDNCRKRRIKCKAYPDAASLDAPCVICTEAGAPDLCTYSKPPRKRGPQAGKARSLAEKCATLERLLGYLATTVPHLEAHVSAFAHHSAHPPPDPSPGSSSNASSSAAAATAQGDFYQYTYQSTRIPEILDAILPPLVSARQAAKLKLDLPPAGLTTTSPPMPTLPNPATYPAAAGAVVDDAAMTFLEPNPHPPGTLPSIPFALHALANAAVPDHHQHHLPQYQPYRHDLGGHHSNAPAKADDQDGYDHGTSPRAFRRGSSEKGKGRALAGSDTAAAVQVDVFIPDAATRSALLDLYFNQVVQPSFPMLDKSAFLRWSAHLPTTATPVPHPNSLSVHPHQNDSTTSRIPPYLYLSIFALASIYVPPSSPLRSHLPPDAPHVYADAARDHLLQAVIPTRHAPDPDDARDRDDAAAKSGVGLEAIQSAVLLAMSDWGQDQVDRAWFMSSLAVTLAVSQSLHLPLSPPHRRLAPSRAARLKTLHSVLIIHFLLSLRLDRVPLSIAMFPPPPPPDRYRQNPLGDGTPMSPPPTDEAENWDLWRSDKTAAELRTEWGGDDARDDDVEFGYGASALPGSGSGKTGSGVPPPPAPPTSSLLKKQQEKDEKTKQGANGGGGGSGAGGTPFAAAQAPSAAAAVPSNSLVVFARLAELCQIGLDVIRRTLSSLPRTSSATSSSRSAKEPEYGQEQVDVEEADKTVRDELSNRLRAWEDALEPDLRIGTVPLYASSPSSSYAEAAAVSLVRDRPRWTVAMHLVLATLRLRLEQNDSDKTASILKRISQILDQLRAVFTPFRSLPMAELPLYSASAVLVSSRASTTTVEEEAERRDVARSIATTASELGRVLPVAKRTSARLGPLITKAYSSTERPVNRGAVAETAELAATWEPKLPVAAASAAALPAPQRPSISSAGADHAASAIAPAQPYPSTAEPFQAFLSYAQDLGPAAEPSTILDFGSWDQSDLLVSLGLVGAPGPGSGALAPIGVGGGGSGGAGNVHDNWAAWGGPIEGAAAGMHVGEAENDSFPLPVMMETGLGSIFAHSQQHEGSATASLGAGMAIDGVGPGVGGVAPPIPLPPPTASSTNQVVTHHQPTTCSYPTRDPHGVLSPASIRGVPPGGADAMAISPDPQLYAFPRTTADSTSQSTGMAFQPRHQAQQNQQAEAQRSGTDNIHSNSAYLPRSLFGTPVPPGSNMSVSSLEGQQAYEAAVGTDLLTRWLDRGTLGFTPEPTPGLGGDGSRGDASGARS
ncbi:hypothetical protein JCM3774_000447 [Rhodotorula dairenensis]